MTQDATHIQCPNCGTEIDVNEILYRQLDAELKQKYNDQLVRERRKVQARQSELEDQRRSLAKQQAEFESQVEAAVTAGISAQRSEMEAVVRARLEAEQAERIGALEADNARKSEQVKELNRTRAEMERLRREKDELKDSLELEAERTINQRVTEERDRIRKSEEARATLQIAERDQVIGQLKEQLQLAQRKAEQGSMQLQGEAQELVIEEWLTAQFPLDLVEEIKKGAHGADCLQIVNTRSRRGCGSIYYESKRTKNFQPAWIEKFKADIREKNASIGVLVTEAMPPGMERMGLREGVWICSFEEFKGLCLVLRESLIQLSSAIAAQENKGDKMGMLYDFLTSNEFRQQIEAIVEGFTQMQIDLDAEKRAMQGIWKKREKQIEKVLLNTNYMYSSVRGIAGSAVQPVPQLELQLEKDIGSG